MVFQIVGFNKNIGCTYVVKSNFSTESYNGIPKEEVYASLAFIDRIINILKNEPVEIYYLGGYAVFKHKDITYDVDLNNLQIKFKFNDEPTNTSDLETDYFIDKLERFKSCIKRKFL